MIFLEGRDISMNSTPLLMLLGLLVSGSLLQPSSVYHPIPVEATSQYYIYHLTIATDSQSHYLTQVASWERSLR